MAEAAAAISLGASALAFIQLGYKIGSRLKDFFDTTKDAPKAFRDIADRLPLLVVKVDDIRKAYDNGDIDPVRADALSRAVNGCKSQMTDLETILATLLPSHDDDELSTKVSRLEIVSKAIRSVFKEKEIRRIQSTLQGYEITLSLYFSDISSGWTDHSRLGTDQEVKKYYDIPVLSAPKFVSRKMHMNAIQEIFSPPPTSDVVSRDRTKVAVLLGMGGQGKTQLALEYCHVVKATHSVFWVDATSNDTATQSFSRISRLLSRQEFSSPEDVRKYVIRTLEDFSAPFLLVFDNFDHPSQFKSILSFLPQTKNCDVLFTSRHGDSKRLGMVVPLTAMSNEEGAELLLLQANIVKTIPSTNVAIAIVKKLSGLALAIDQAGSYLSARNLPLEAFDELYEAQKLSILQHTPEVGGAYYRTMIGEEKETHLSVFTTWEMSVLECGETAMDREPLINLLTLAAFMGSSSVGQNLVEIYYHEVVSRNLCLTGPFFTNGALDLQKYQDSIVRLLNISLVQSVDLTSSNIRFSLHPLIAEWLRLRIELSGRQRYSIDVIEILKHFTKQAVDDYVKPVITSHQDAQEAIVHLNQCIRNDQTYLSTDGVISTHLQDAVFAFAQFLQIFDRLLEAEELLQKGMNTRTTVNMVNKLSIKLAFVYMRQNKLQLAEDILQKYLKSQENTIGPEDLDSGETSIAIMCLGEMYYRQSKFEAAEEIWKWFLANEENENVRGLESENFYWTSMRLGNLYRYNGNYSEAERRLTESLSGFKRLLPASNDLILDTMGFLGLLFQQKGDLESAVNMFQEVLTIREEKYGPHNTLTLSSVYLLGGLYRKLERFDAAEQFLNRALEGQTKVLGPEHPFTLDSASELAALYLVRDQFSLAESRLLDVLSIGEVTLGLEHVVTLHIVGNLGEVYFRQNKLMLAKQMLNRARLGLEGMPDNLHILIVANNLAITYQKLSMYDEATPLFARAAQGYEKLHGPQHADTLNATYNLATTYQELSMYDEATPLFARAAQGYEKLHGPQHVYTLGSIRHLDECVEMQRSRQARTGRWLKRVFE